MPAYHTHALFGEEFYDTKKSDENLVKVDINKNDIKTYSLGIDLLNFNFQKIDPHNDKTGAFLTEMIKKVKEDHFIDDPIAISILYGHVLHYYLDIFLHPYIYYHELGMNTTGSIGSHTIFEAKLSDYFLQKLKGIPFTKIKPTYFNQGNLNNPVSKEIINTLYKNIYNCSNGVLEYYKTLWMLTALEGGMKYSHISPKIIKELSGYNKVAKINDLKPNDFSNESHEIWYHPITNEIHNESALELYQQALNSACEAINTINHYLYGNESFDKVAVLFPDISYDTGISCSLGHEMPFYKKYPNMK